MFVGVLANIVEIASGSYSGNMFDVFLQTLHYAIRVMGAMPLRQKEEKLEIKSSLKSDN